MYDLNEILLKSVEAEASDIHLTVGRAPSYRIDGCLIPLKGERLTPQMMEVLLMPILDGRRREDLRQTGQTDFAYAVSGMGRFRVNVFRQRGTLAAVIRNLPYVIPGPEEIGLPEEITEFTAKRRGLILVTGPAGCGKSTTLASLIQNINKKHARHIITLENPIEYLHRHDKSIVNQREIGTDAADYPQALWAAVRQDPDVIMVGEMNDMDTISMVLNAAENGHLVFASLHTTGAENTIERIIDVFPPAKQQQIRIQLASVLECIISQQLIKRADGEGRVAAMEILTVNQVVRGLIRDDKTYQLPSVMQAGRKLGMQTMDDALYELYISRIITAEETVLYAQDPAGMNKRINFMWM